MKISEPYLKYDNVSSLRGVFVSNHCNSCLKKFKRLQNKKCQPQTQLTPMGNRILNVKDIKYDKYQQQIGKAYNQYTHHMKMVEKGHQSSSKLYNRINFLSIKKKRHHQKEEITQNYENLKRKNSLPIQRLKTEPISLLQSYNISRSQKIEYRQKRRLKEQKQRKMEDQFYKLPVKLQKIKDEALFLKRLKIDRQKKLQSIKMPIKQLRLQKQEL